MTAADDDVVVLGAHGWSAILFRVALNPDKNSTEGQIISGAPLHPRESRLSVELIDAYRKARYAFRSDLGDWSDLPLGASCQDLKECMNRMRCASAALITASNPGSEPRSPLHNRRANAALRAEVSGRQMAVLEARGSDPSGSWPEEDSLLILDVTQGDACALARSYRQNALLWAGQDAVARLLLIR